MHAFAFWSYVNFLISTSFKTSTKLCQDHDWSGMIDLYHLGQIYCKRSTDDNVRQPFQSEKVHVNSKPPRSANLFPLLDNIFRIMMKLQLVTSLFNMHKQLRFSI